MDKITFEKLKVGDKVILNKGNNGQNSKFNDTVFTIIACYPQYIICKSEVDNTQLSLFYNHSGYKKDDFELADNKTMIDLLQKRLDSLLKEKEELVKEIERLEKYPTEEDWVAHKLNLILQAKGEKAIAEILKELKTSSYL